MEKIELLPESRYSKEKNGLIKEWLAGDLAKRTEFIYYLEEQYSVKISADIQKKVTTLPNKFRSFQGQVPSSVVPEPKY